MAHAVSSRKLASVYLDIRTEGEHISIFQDTLIPFREVLSVRRARDGTYTPGTIDAFKKA